MPENKVFAPRYTPWGEEIPTVEKPSKAAEQKKVEEKVVPKTTTTPILKVNPNDALNLSKFRNSFPEYDNYSDTEIVQAMKQKEPDRFGKLNDKTVIAVLNKERGTILPNFRNRFPDYKDYTDDEILESYKLKDEGLKPLNNSQLAYVMENEMFKTEGKRKPNLKNVNFRDGISFQEFAPMMGIKPKPLEIAPLVPIGNPMPDSITRPMVKGIAGLLKSVVTFGSMVIDMGLSHGTPDFQSEEFSKRFINDDKFRSIIKTQYQRSFPETKGMTDENFLKFANEHKPDFAIPKWAYDNIVTKTLDDVQKVTEGIQKKYGTGDIKFISENYGWQAGVEAMVANAVESIPATLVAGAVAYYTKSPDVGALLVALSTMPQSYFETKHKSYNDKLKYTIGTAAAEYLGERYGTFGAFDKYIRKINVPGLPTNAVTGLMRKAFPMFIVDSILRNSVEEFSTQMAQGYMEKMWVPGAEKKTLGQLLDESVQAGIVGAIQAGLMAPLGGTLVTKPVSYEPPPAGRPPFTPPGERPATGPTGPGPSVPPSGGPKPPPAGGRTTTTPPPPGGPGGQRTQPPPGEQGRPRVYPRKDLNDDELGDFIKDLGKEINLGAIPNEFLNKGKTDVILSKIIGALYRKYGRAYESKFWPKHIAQVVTSVKQKVDEFLNDVSGAFQN
jgi:hypothetical protein